MERRTRRTIKSITKDDYLYCEDCKMIVDFWKYDFDLKATGHENCKTRRLTDEEFKIATQDCAEAGCFVEE